MHICFVCREYVPSLRGGGIASYIKEMAIGLHNAGHQVTIICASDDTTKESIADENGIHVIRLKGGDFYIPEVEKKNNFCKFRIFYRFYSYRKKILQTVNKLKDIDIIEVPDFGAEAYFLNKLSIPIVIRLHTPSLFDRETLGIAQYHGWKKLFYWTDKKELKVIQQAQYISSCSTSLKEWCVNNLSIDEKKIHVTYNPIKLSSSASLKIFENEKPTYQIVFAGTISKVKGCADLIEAGRILTEKYHINITLTLYGKTGSYAEELKPLEKRYPWLKIAGKINRDQLIKEYQSADLVCFPSWWDNMPMVCIEAMQAGAIVLGSSSGGMSEIITDGKNGFLAEPRNPELWAEKMYTILNLNKSQKTLISNNSVQRINHDFSTETITKQMIEYYQNVINNFKQHKHESSIR